MNIPRPRAVLAALLLLLSAACHQPAEPVLGGEYLGSLDSPFSVEGVALIEITHADLRSISAPGRILVARGVTERTVRLLIINSPQNQIGGPITFVVRMAEGAGPPQGEVLAAAGPDNRPRDFTGGYAVRFTRRDPDAFTPQPGPVRSGPPAQVPFIRLVAPFFPGGRPLEPEEQVHVDRRGNGNEVFDL
ncbi:MAG TPA: hypothetical protein VLK84_15630, partial [Longimicrobium sp.]|nr:hypothetical protein [Longimicrobium sp.]